MESKITYTSILYKLENFEYYYDNIQSKILDKYNLFTNKLSEFILNKDYTNCSNYIQNGEILKNSLLNCFNKKIINYNLIIKEYKFLINNSNNKIEIEIFKSLINDYNNKIKNIKFLKNKESKYNFDINYIKRYMDNE